MELSRPATVVYVATSLDRFIARRNGSIDWLGEPDPNDDHGWAGFIRSIDHIVMGRNTFETVLSFEGDWPYEGTPPTVLSSTLREVPAQLNGKAEIRSLEPLAILERLRKMDCKRVYVDGGQTVQRFLRDDLIDELILTTLPILIGEGIPLFGALADDLTWEHVSTQKLHGGLVQSTYRRSRP